MKAKSKVSEYKKKVEPENSIAIERLERLFEIIKKSNSWKSKYEYFQLAIDVNENSIIVSET
ncbi:hypothetical protein [Flavobacterium macrobrachii]|uniref:Uncharacterized protein n=1 Tax=Flavobacterium macrobrachii TaxID=591204 RepID=A0ABS2CW14_9FLAO|nr:hypothetical protein [Flavobacterium macrobrachii]MBM6499147.1 hypothetical protein [Flavobacterium macrobrachii]